MKHIITINPQTDPIWLKLLSRYKSAVFHSPEWIRVLAETYGFDMRAQVLLDDAGMPLAGIPYGHVADVLGQRIASLPFSDFCDPLVETQEHWDALIGSLLNQCRPITMRCLHSDLPLADERFKLVKQAKWHRIDISSDLDAIWARCDDTSHRAIKKAQRDGVIIQVRYDREAVRAFFEMHLSVRKYKYKLLAQPYAFFENIWKHWIEPQQGAALMAIYDGDTIAATLALKWQDTLYYKFNASVQQQLNVRPNDLLIWELIQYAKSLGCVEVDLGLSDWDQEGLLRFKRKYATEEKTISFLKYVPDGNPPTEAETQLRTLFGQLTSLFTDESVPNPVSERAGELLYRYFV